MAESIFELPWDSQILSQKKGAIDENHETAVGRHDRPLPAQAQCNHTDEEKIRGCGLIVEAGASRLGTSGSVAIIQQLDHYQKGEK